MPLLLQWVCFKFLEQRRYILKVAKVINTDQRLTCTDLISGKQASLDGFPFVKHRNMTANVALIAVDVNISL